jgi:hypothetical protein
MKVDISMALYFMKRMGGTFRNLQADIKMHFINAARERLASSSSPDLLHFTLNF